MRRALLATLCALLILAAPAAAVDISIRGDVPHSPNELLVGFERDAAADGAVASLARTAGAQSLGSRTAVAPVRRGESLAQAARRLARRPGVAFVRPNYRARIADAFVPNDPGRGTAGQWQDIQWNFVGEFGVNALPAWGYMRDIGKEGGIGAIVAVIDTGVAYENAGRFRRSPDLAGVRIRSPWDFIDGDRHANDRNGHGTHVASTIAETTNNGIGVTGLAYNATIMPIRALNGAGLGDELTVARAIRYAAKKGADIINLSVEFDVRLSARDLPVVVSAMRYARSRGALVVAASGNQAARAVAYPARSSYAFAVGSTTVHGCLADYSDIGRGLDLVAPGGGADSTIVDLRRESSDRRNCNFTGRPLTIYQMTFSRSPRRFSLVSGYAGTSMATPHVSATAALVISSGVLGPDPTPALLGQRLRETARDLGFPGYDVRYGHGLVDAFAALTAPPPPAIPQNP